MRSPWNWRFKNGHVAAIMMPQKYISEFKKEISGIATEKIFDEVPIIYTKLIDML